MDNINALNNLIERFSASLDYYKNPRNNYNEHSCRIEYIDPLLKLFGWDVANERGLAPQYREVIAENYSTPTDRPDYTMTLRGVAKFFVEAKKPAVDITSVPDPAFQTRKYGWNANHRIAVLTNFEYLAIYDTCYIPKEEDGCAVARYRIFHFTEYAERYDDIVALISKDVVYSGEFDRYLDDNFPATGGEKQQVDTLFLKQINDWDWRVSLSNELYRKGGRYQSLEVLNDVVLEFINQIVFLRICEDKNLPLYHKLQDTVTEPEQLQAKLEELFRSADHRYNSGMFSGEDIVFDLSSAVISEIIKGLSYPQSPYLFNIIEPNLLGKIYEMFLTEQLVLLPDGTIGLGKKKDCLNRSVVTTPTEIVKYMVEKTLSRACEGKTPAEILDVHIADIACGSGIFLEEAFSYLQNYCIQKYLSNGEQEHLLEIGNGLYKLPLDEKKRILCSCIYGIDIDIHAVEVAKFSLLIKLIENETTPSVADETPILPDLSTNILFGNSLVSSEELQGMQASADELIELAPFDWSSINNGNLFSVIIGNPPYVNTEGMHALLPIPEVEIYKKRYKTSYKQFDKYFIFIEQAVRKTAENGYICYIVPNKFFKIGAGEKLRALISKDQMLVSLDDFGDAQLFEDKTIYSSILLLQKTKQDTFVYSSIDSANRLWAGEEESKIELNASILNKLPWRLTTDMDFLAMLQKLDQISVPLTKHTEIFNGIQTSAERPTPIYWFSSEDIIAEYQDTIEIRRDGHNYTIEKAILRPYFKPTRQDEQGTIDIARHIENNTPFIGDVAYSQREFSYDNNLTELVRHTIEFIKRKPYGRNLLIKVKEEVKLIIDATPAYESYDRQTIIEQNKKNTVRHAYFREYLALQRLCILILRHQKHQIGFGSKQIYGILFDGAWLWEEYINSLIEEAFYHPMNKGGKGAQRLFDGNIGLIYPDFISRDNTSRIIADAKYKPIDNIGNRDYLQVLAYMFRFDAKAGYYLYPEAEGANDLVLWMNQGSTYEANVMPRDDIHITKHGLKIPTNAPNYPEFVIQMKTNETVFMTALVNEARS